MADFFTLLSFVALPLLPAQKAQTHERKRTWSSSPRVGYLSVAILVATFLYSTTITVLTMMPSTACLKIVGGDGCASNG